LVLKVVTRTEERGYFGFWILGFRFRFRFRFFRFTRLPMLSAAARSQLSGLSQVNSGPEPQTREKRQRKAELGSEQSYIAKDIAGSDLPG